MTIPIAVHIKQIATGEVHVYADETEYDEDGFWSSYMWEEGNYNCDCNRALFFGRAIGVELWDEYRPCGHDRYKVRIFEAKMHGEMLYDEWKS